MTAPTISTLEKSRAEAKIATAKMKEALSKPVVKTSGAKLVPPAAVKTEKQLKMEDFHKQLVAILKEHDNKEGDIPLEHPYWSILNAYRGLR
jgi:hypothetical protein